MSNQDSEKLRAIQEFANNYPISDYFEITEGRVYCFSQKELADLMSKLWDVAERKTHEDIHNMVHNWGKR